MSILSFGSAEHNTCETSIFPYFHLDKRIWKFLLARILHAHLQVLGPLWQGSGSGLSAAQRPTPGYCSPEPFFSILLSSLTDATGAGEARFFGSAAPAPAGTYRPMGGRQGVTVQEPEPAGALPNGP